MTSRGSSESSSNLKYGMLMVCVLMARVAHLALDFHVVMGVDDSNGRRLWKQSAVHGGVVAIAVVK